MTTMAPIVTPANSQEDLAVRNEWLERMYTGSRLSEADWTSLETKKVRGSSCGFQ